MLFENAKLGTRTVANRIVRSATFEGMCDEDGHPLPAYGDYLARLAQGGTGTIITGFAFVCRQGKAMQPGQLGLNSPENNQALRDMTGRVHAAGSLILAQLAHTGRQSSEKATGETLVSPSARGSFYFGSKPRALSTSETEEIIRQFADSAEYARQAGFDGVQIHAAHGYLVHQFLLPQANRRRDRFGIDPQKGIGTAFLAEVISAVRQRCGPDFILLVKISWSDDYLSGSQPYLALLEFLAAQPVDGIEVSYGTMDYALNIFRGKTIPLDTVLNFNPRFMLKNPLLRLLWKTFAAPVLKLRLHPFTPCYNLTAASLARQITGKTVLSVGGFRSGPEIQAALQGGHADFVSLSRPLVCEPDFPRRLKTDPAAVSRCIDCNICAVMCDSPFATRCYMGHTPSMNTGI